MARTPQIGDMAPDFELLGTDGPFRLSDHRGQPVVLLFYPGDETPVCTKQFCSYRDRGEELSALDAVVVGVSAQDVASHQSFIEHHGLNVPLLADTSKQVASQYGVSAPVMGTRRAVIVVDAEGRIAHRKVHVLGLSFATVEEISSILAGLPAHETA
ncbi:MAG: peroxiredoxin [Solirubrobacteraceae bacterium]|nr:peroxiredoxin [Solirubrobacteraceae bacterium]